jgi:hypothetical protein
VTGACNAPPPITVAKILVPRLLALRAGNETAFSQKENPNQAKFGLRWKH